MVLTGAQVKGEEIEVQKFFKWVLKEDLNTEELPQLARGRNNLYADNLNSSFGARVE